MYEYVVLLVNLVTVYTVQYIGGLILELGQKYELNW